MSKPLDRVVPNHLAVICDGNRRWARNNKVEVLKGHEHAVNKVFEPLIDHATQRGIKYLTFWIFSTENWQRDKHEVEGLMNLFRGFFTRQIDELHAKGVRVNMIGNLGDFPKDIQQKISEGMKKTRNNKAVTVTLAMSYGGRDELTRAVKEIASEVAAGKLSADDVTQEIIGQHLDTAKTDIPDPDFIVRTSGEQRMSGFMLWQIEYAEFYFPDFHFPEFTPQKLDEVIEEFSKRKRRFGK
jgi:undecaprenyl diphosphate synthase